MSRPAGTSASPSPGPSAAGLLPLSGEEWLRLGRLWPGLRDPTQGTSRGLVVAEMRFCLCFCRSRPSATGTDVWRPRECSLKSGLGGQLMGNGQVRHIHPDCVPHPLILGQGGSTGLVSETPCRLQSPLSPCGPPSVSLQEQSALSRWLGPGYRRAMRQ